MVLELPLIVAGLAAGVAASPHCATMCAAPCAALTGGCQRNAGGFHVGRLLGYMAGGALAATSVAALGAWSQTAPALRPVWTALHLALLALGLWWLAVEAFSIPAYLLPGPGPVFRRLVTDAAMLWTHSQVTLTEILLGFGLTDGRKGLRFRYFNTHFALGLGFTDTTVADFLCYRNTSVVDGLGSGFFTQRLDIA